MSDIRELLDILKKDIQDGRLPDPKENPKLYDRILNLLDIAKEEGVKLTIKMIADELGVNYAHLRKNLSMYRKMISAGVEKTIDIQPESVEPPRIDIGEQVEQVDEEDKYESKNEEKPVTSKVETRIIDRATQYLGKKAEELAKEEVIRIIKTGKRVIEQYEKPCLANGFQDINECIDAAFDSLFNIAPRVIEVENKYNGCLKLLSSLMKMTDPYMKIVTLIDEAAKRCEEGLVDLIIEESL